MARRNLILLAAAVVLGLIPLFMSFKGDNVFGGADGLAQDAIHQIRPDYQPWFSAIWEPPSKEIESLLFMLQAALGAGLLGYYIGLRRGEAKGRRIAAADAPR
jgi:cobalt/nickel transport protein